jgi:mono/diheme cytochrome c family protein
MKLFARISKMILVPILAYAACAQDSVIAGRKTFETRCSVCHGSDGNGGEMGPGIARRVRGLTDAQIKKTIAEGIPARGMPAFNLKDTEMEPLVSFLHSLLSTLAAPIRLRAVSPQRSTDQRPHTRRNGHLRSVL